MARVREDRNHAVSLLRPAATSSVGEHGTGMRPRQGKDTDSNCDAHDRAWLRN